MLLTTRRKVSSKTPKLNELTHIHTRVTDIIEKMMAAIWSLEMLFEKVSNFRLEVNTAPKKVTSPTIQNP